MIKEAIDKIHKENDMVKDIEDNLFNKVNKILQKHLEIRHINGGYATKIKYEKLRKG